MVTPKCLIVFLCKLIQILFLICKSQQKINKSDVRPAQMDNKYLYLCIPSYFLAGVHTLDHATVTAKLSSCVCLIMVHWLHSSDCSSVLQDQFSERCRQLSKQNKHITQIKSDDNDPTRVISSHLIKPHCRVLFLWNIFVFSCFWHFWQPRWRDDW